MTRSMQAPASRVPLAARSQERMRTTGTGSACSMCQRRALQAVCTKSSSSSKKRQALYMVCALPPAVSWHPAATLPSGGGLKGRGDGACVACVARSLVARLLGTRGVLPCGHAMPLHGSLSDQAVTLACVAARALSAMPMPMAGMTPDDFLIPAQDSQAAQLLPRSSSFSRVPSIPVPRLSSFPLPVRETAWCGQEPLLATGMPGAVMHAACLIWPCVLRAQPHKMSVMAWIGPKPG